MLRLFIVLLVVVSSLILPTYARADVTFASFSAPYFAGPVGSILQVTATFQGNTVNYGSKHPLVLVPVEFSPQISSTCRVQKRFIANTSQPEFTACEVTATRFDRAHLAVAPSIPGLGNYEEYLVEMTMQLLVTTLASPGETYAIAVPDTLSSYPNQLPPLTASLHVLDEPDPAPPHASDSSDTGITSLSAACASSEFGRWNIEAKIVYDLWDRPDLPALDTSGRLGDVSGYYVMEGWKDPSGGEIWRFGYNESPMVPPSLLVWISSPDLLGLVNTESINAVLDGKSTIDDWWLDHDRAGSCVVSGTDTPNLNTWTRRT